MRGLEPVHRGLALLLGVVGVVLWFHAFPLDPRGFDWPDVAMEGSYAVAVALGYRYITRLRVRILEIGWVLFLFSLVLEVVDEFTKETEIWNTYLTGGMGVVGLALIGLGFRESARRRRKERSRRRRADEAILQAKEQAERANVELREAIRVKEDLLSIVAHDFRSPLTVIQGYAEVLQARVADEETRQVLQAVVDQARRLATLAADLLVMSRIDSGALPLATGPVRVVDLAREVAASRSAEPGVDVVVEGGGDDLIVEGDEAWLQQVLENLVNNAVKYSRDDAHVRLAVRRTPEGAEVAVADRGIGIAPEDLPRLFQRFGRLEAAREDKVEGTGLGLFICRSIVEAHGGRIWAESEPGRGSTFRFVLPLAAG